MALKDGDIITLDYEGRTDGVLFDTTLEKVAKKEDSIVENRVYAPITVVVGDGRLVPGLENDLKNNLEIKYRILEDLAFSSHQYIPEKTASSFSFFVDHF